MRIRAAVLREVGAERPYAGSAPMVLEELELQDPGPGEVLVRITAAGVCHSDLSVIDGNRIRPLPMALGHEAAGTVVDTGPGVADVVPGDQVVLVYVPSCGHCRYCSSGRPALCPDAAAANGRGDLVRGGSRLRTPDGEEVRHHLGVSGFADHAVVDRTSLVVIDKDIEPGTAALFGCAMLTGFGAVMHTAHVRPGESVAVFGLGGVGQAAVMSAAVAGAHPLIAVDPVPAKQQLALELGATHACSPDELAEVLAAHSPGGVDVALEVVGSAAVLRGAYDATARGGRTVSVGLPHPDAEVSLPAMNLVAENRSVLGSYMGSSQPQQDIPAMIALWRAGRLPVHKLATAELPLDEINTAMDNLADGKAVRQVLLPAAP
ncbi:alcohol dehydrogenase catalytic domain-containing protein [Nakamurella sp. YIM 132087]|uniref:Alcohol dehydrogenase catalytic domain-containing protein n=1 Tax=Nakamurella alba TaxID=2665158 RepID=A0A7K1FQI5_9ACTN|nr:zinc-binding dehydrogenase [Nakamurella alba]MTD16401.1 alcohol dehydrogenase catalytic domain-containing protein [Nakamurella alba]